MPHKRLSKKQREAAAAFAKRSAASKRGWATRRRHMAQAEVQDVLTRPRGKNIRYGSPAPYKETYSSGAYSENFDFRGLLSQEEIRYMARLGIEDAIGHYVRFQMVATDETVLRGFYKGVVQATDQDLRRFLFAHKPGKPFYFWTPEFGPVESFQEAWDYISGLLADTEGTAQILRMQVLH